MPFSSTGVPTYAIGAPATTATAGNIIASATWNSIHADLLTMLGQAMAQAITPGTVQRNIAFGNGGFEVWQRGTSISVAAGTIAYTADRWYLNPGAAENYVVASVAGLTAGSVQACKLTRTAGQTGVVANVFGYPLDTDSAVILRNQKVSVSFVAKAGLNWSPASGALTVNVIVGTGNPIRQALGSYAGATTILTATQNLTTTATTFNIVGTIAAGATTGQAELQFVWTPVGTAGADDSFTVDDIEFEIQNPSQIGAPVVWTTEAYDRTPFSVSLLDCQLHYKKTFPYSVAPVQNAGTNGALGVFSYGNFRAGLNWSLAPSMRTNTYNLTFFSTSGASNLWADVTGAASLAVTATAIGSNSVFLYSATVAAAEHWLYLHATADASI